MASPEIVGAKLFPEKYERDMVISNFLKGKNRTELVKEALYRLAVSYTPPQSNNIQEADVSEARLLKEILGQLERLNTTGIPSAHIPVARTGSHNQNVNVGGQYTESDIPVVKEFLPDDSLPSIDELEITSSEVTEVPARDMVAARKSLLKGFKGLSL